MQPTPILMADPQDKAALYRHLAEQLKGIVAEERDFIANSANCAAILFGALSDVNWAGFYILRGVDLVLGPFQGKPACVRIGPGRGVCGAAAEQRRTLVVPDVHAFPGHIACDGASNSEIVIPLVAAERLVGVLDVDSPVVGRFDATDAAGLEVIATILLAASDLSRF
jgi:L-methionine (R)-S-oxide reductase